VERRPARRGGTLARMEPEGGSIRPSWAGRDTRAHGAGWAAVGLDQDPSLDTDMCSEDDSASLGRRGPRAPVYACRRGWADQGTS